MLRRVQRLLDKRIIREITPIFDTRALGYQSMLVAAKVDARHPHRAAQVINSHPGVTHNYLRNHDFNLWFTIAVEPDSRLGLQGTLDVMAERAGAESIRQLPTLKLFKIRMDLEMEKRHGRARRRRRGGRADGARPDRGVGRGRRHDPRHAGPDGRAPGRLRARRRAPRRLRGGGAAAGCARCRSAAGCGAWPRSSTTAAPASPRTAWACGRCPEDEILETGKRMAAFRGISHCYQRPTYADWPYSVFTMAHGRSKEECDAILDSIASRPASTERATLYSSTEFKKVRMLYFTDDFARWEAEHAP